LSITTCRVAPDIGSCIVIREIDTIPCIVGSDIAIDSRIVAMMSIPDTISIVMEVVEYDIGIVRVYRHSDPPVESGDLTVLESESLIPIVPMYSVTRTISGDLVSLAIESDKCRTGLYIHTFSYRGDI
jgi:hypothetical protein